jgi:hypothetical protein
MLYRYLDQPEAKKGTLNEDDVALPWHGPDEGPA